MLGGRCHRRVGGLQLEDWPHAACARAQDPREPHCAVGERRSDHGRDAQVPAAATSRLAPVEHVDDALQRHLATDLRPVDRHQHVARNAIGPSADDHQLADADASACGRVDLRDAGRHDVRLLRRRPGDLLHRAAEAAAVGRDTDAVALGDVLLVEAEDARLLIDAVAERAEALVPEAELEARRDLGDEDFEGVADLDGLLALDGDPPELARHAAEAGLAAPAHLGEDVLGGERAVADHLIGGALDGFPGDAVVGGLEHGRFEAAGLERARALDGAPDDVLLAAEDAELVLRDVFAVGLCAKQIAVGGGVLRDAFSSHGRPPPASLRLWRRGRWGAQ